MSLLQELAKRNMQGGVGVHGLVSLESAAADAGREAAAEIYALQGHAEESQAVTDEIKQSAVLSDGLETLVDETVDAYGKEGIDERGAELLRISVECLIRAAGLPLHVDAVVPSFESGQSRSDYSIEAEAKKASIISRLVEFLKTAWMKLVSVVRRFYSKMITSTSSVGKYIDNVKARVDKVEGKTPDRNIKVSKKVAQIFGGKAGQKPSLDVLLHGTMNVYAGFVRDVQGDLGEIAKIKRLTASSSEADVQAWLGELDKHALSKANTGLMRLDNRQFANGWRFQVSHTARVGNTNTGNDSTDNRAPLAGASASIKHTPDANAVREIPFPSVPQMQETMKIAKDAVTSLKKVEDIVKVWIENADVAVRVLTNISKHHEGKEFILDKKQHAAVGRTVKSYLAMNDIYGKAYILTLPVMLDQIRSIVRVVDACVWHAKGGDVKDHNPIAGHLGHDGDGHKPVSTPEEHDYHPFEEVKKGEHA